MKNSKTYMEVTSFIRLKYHYGKPKTLNLLLLSCISQDASHVISKYWDWDNRTDYPLGCKKDKGHNGTITPTSLSFLGTLTSMLNVCQKDTSLGIYTMKLHPTS